MIYYDFHGIYYYSLGVTHDSMDLKNIEPHHIAIRFHEFYFMSACMAYACVHKKKKTWNTACVCVCLRLGNGIDQFKNGHTLIVCDFLWKYMDVHARAPAHACVCEYSGKPVRETSSRTVQEDMLHRFIIHGYLVNFKHRCDMNGQWM